MKIAVLGTRGFPNVQGGVETHCENLYPLLTKLGCEVIVFGRSPYVGKRPFEYKGIKMIPLPCPKNKFLETFVHTFEGLFAAKKLKPDILHIHAVGPSLLLPIAKMLGFKVIMTHHGPDYMRKKWNWFGKLILKMGENNGCRNADDVICVSESVSGNLRRRFKRNITYIPNGITIPEKSCQSDQELKRYGVEKGKYILAVGRFVPEKGFHDLIEAFKSVHDSGLMADGNNYKLVIVGDSDHEDKYGWELKKKAADVSGVVLTGILKGKPLQDLYSNAGLFVLPSYYEGLPIVLLEAMSYGLSCIVSDIPANREAGLADSRYFTPGGIEGIKSKIQEFILKPLTLSEKKEQIEAVTEKYDWECIARKTFNRISSASYKSLSY